MLVGRPPDCAAAAGIALGSYFILYSSFIPISLIVSLEFVKVFQGALMERDPEMFCGLNQRALQCRTVGLNEELGQVDYILTDKTGTLTCNRMLFRSLAVADRLYGHAPPSAPPPPPDYQLLTHRRSPVLND